MVLNKHILKLFIYFIEEMIFAELYKRDMQKKIRNEKQEVKKY